MASNIKFKRSAVQNRVPTTAQLELGELALNTYDGKLYTEKNSGSAAVVEIGSILSSLVVDGDNGGGNGDVTFHGATASRDITWDASADSLIFNDNAKAVFGTGSDLELYHGGTASYISHSGTGNLYIHSDTVAIRKQNQQAYFLGQNGAATLYNGGNERIATTADGADISGTGSLKLPVGTTAQRNSSPTAGDMRYNSTTGSFEGYTTGWGELGGSGIGIGSTSVNPGSGVVNPVIGVGFTTINFVGAGLSVTGYGSTVVVDLGGAVSRKYGRKIHAYTATANQTTFAGLSYTNGASQISVYLNGAKLSAATYTATSGNTVVLGTGASVGDEVEIICIDSGVDLTRNVTSYTATANQTAFTGLGYSDGGDLDVYLNGIRLAQSDYTANNGTSLTLATGASVGDLLEVVDMGQGAQWSSGFGADPDDIYRLNGGVGIGTTNPTDKLNIVGNAEVIGVLTATTFKGDGSALTGIDTDKIEEGNSSVEVIDSGTGQVDIDIDGAEKYRFTDGSLNFATGTAIRMTGIAGGTGGGLHLDGAGNNGRIAVFGNSGTLSLLHSTGSGDTNMGVFNKTGSVDLYHNGSKKFETAAYGVNVTGTIDTDGIIVSGISTFSEDVKFIGATSGRDIVWDKSNDYLMVKDNARIVFGNGGDLSIRHLSSNNTSYVSSTTNNVIHEFNVGKDWTLQTTAAEKRIHCPITKSVELYWNGSKKFETTNTGAIITGICTATDFSGAAGGAADFPNGLTGTTATFSGNLTVTGNLQVDGTQTTVNTATMTVEDKNIEIAKGAANDAAADGAGITVDSGDGDKTWNWVDATNAWTSNQHIQVAAGKVFGFADDTDTYIDRPSANTIKFTTGNAERFKIDNNGNVSIGNNPTVHTDTIFHVEDSGETNVKVEGSTSTLGARISLQNNDTTANAYSQYAFNDAGGQSTSAIQGINTDQTNNYGELAFLTRNAQGSPPAERMRITKDGFIHCIGSSDIRLTIGSQGTAGENTANWLRGSGTNLMYNAASGAHRWEVGGAQKLELTSGGNLNVGGNYTQTTYTMRVTGSFAATTKSFVIDHPTKEKYKLRYACLEGPENSVYVRGRTKDGIIELPDYWTGLVDGDSITVNLTPIGNKRVWVESINNNSVTIASDDDIDCFYTVFAERKDVEKLVVEEEK